MSLRTILTPNDDAVGVFYEMFKNSLGLAGRVHCIADGEQQDAEYLQDVVDILKCIDTEHPVGRYLVKVFQGHKDVYGCGVKSLVFITGQLYKQVKQLIDQGIPLHYVEELLNEAVEDCISDLHPVTLPVCVESTPPVTAPVSPLTDSVGSREHFHSCAISTPPSPCCQPNCSATLPVRSSAPRSEGSTILGHGFVTHSTSCVKVLDSESLESAGKVSGHRKCTAKEQVVLSSQSCNNMFQKPPENIRVSEKLGCGELFQRKGEMSNKGTSSVSTLTSNSLSTQLTSAHSSVSSLTKSGQLSSRNLNDFLLQRKKPAASLSVQKQIMLSSRHLQQRETVAEAEVFQTLESHSHPQKGNTRHSSRLLLEVEQSGSSEKQSGSDKLSSEMNLRKSDRLRSEVKQNSGSESQQSAELITGMSYEHCLLKSSASFPCKSKEEVEEMLKCLCLPAQTEVLGHNCDAMMPWAGEVMRQQLVYGGLPKLDVKLVHTSEVSGQHGSHRLLHGLAIPADTDIIYTLSSLDSPRSVLLVNGDLTEDYKHKGHKVSLPAAQVIGGQEFLHCHRSSWQDQVINLLQELEVHVVLVRGKVDAGLKEQALSAGIALLDQVPFQALTVLQAACKVDFLTYILDAHQNNVCKGVYLRPLLENWCDTLHPGRKHLTITTPVFIQTLVIFSPSAAGRRLLTEEFWHSMARLAQAAQDGRVLKGGGATELWCVSQLATFSPQTDKGDIHLRWPGEVSLYRPVVRAALAEVFLAYSSTVQQNRSRFQKAGSLHACAPSPQISPSSPNPISPSSPYQISPSSPSQISPFSPNQISLFSSDQSRKLALGENMADVCEKATLVWSHSPSSLDSKQIQQSLTNITDAPSSLQSSGVNQKNLTSDLCAEEIPATRIFTAQQEEAGWGCEIGAVCDNYSSKVNGWRTAVTCVCTVMRMDCLITTGIHHQSQPLQHLSPVVL